MGEGLCPGRGAEKRGVGMDTGKTHGGRELPARQFPLRLRLLEGLLGTAWLLAGAGGSQEIRVERTRAAVPSSPKNQLIQLQALWRAWPMVPTPGNFNYSGHEQVQPKGGSKIPQELLMAPVPLNDLVQNLSDSYRNRRLRE